MTALLLRNVYVRINQAHLVDVSANNPSVSSCNPNHTDRPFLPPSRHPQRTAAVILNLIEDPAASGYTPQGALP